LQIFFHFLLDFFVIKNYNFAMIKIWQTEIHGRLAVSLNKTNVFAFLFHFKNICLFEWIFYIKKMAMSMAILSASISTNRFTAFSCDDCINTGEPAAVHVFLPEIKVVEVILPKSIAAGLLFYWSVVIGHW